jgi:hypothetical protein
VSAIIPGQAFSFMESSEIIPKYINLVGFLLVLCLLAVWLWQQRHARKRFVATIKTMAERGRYEINGQPVEYWLNILNQNTTQPLIAIDTMVLTYKGREFFFIDGGISYTAFGKGGLSCHLEKACLLVAVSQSAVNLLANQEQVFRLITGSTELAAFSVFRWSDFTEMLMAEKR